MAFEVALALISPLVAVGILVVTLTKSSRSERTRVLFELQERYTSSPCRAGRSLIHSQVSGRSPEEVADLDRTMRDSIGRALAIMNTIAICVQAGYCDQRLLFFSMGRSYVLTVKAARVWLDVGERVRGFRAYEQAERLAGQLERDYGPFPTRVATSPDSVQ